jgi:hypothetical protein
MQQLNKRNLSGSGIISGNSVNVNPRNSVFGCVRCVLSNFTVLNICSVFLGSRSNLFFLNGNFIRCKRCKINVKEKIEDRWFVTILAVTKFLTTDFKHTSKYYNGAV